jgi:predicted  nucleic acid-binding Zn-ribbon protein
LNEQKPPKEQSMIKLSSIRSLVAVLAVAFFVIPGAAQEQKKQDPRPAQKNPQAQEVIEPEKQQPTTEEAMRLAISGLANQVGLLTSELRKLRQENERNSNLLELLLYEERLARLEEKIQDAIEYKNQLDAREQEFQRRLRNVQAEVALRGALRRDEAEAALRAELQRALEETRAQQTTYQQRISDLQSQADRIRKRVDMLRKKIEPPEEK